MVSLGLLWVKRFSYIVSGSCRLRSVGALGQAPVLHPGDEGISDMSAVQRAYPGRCGSAIWAEDGRGSLMFGGEFITGTFATGGPGLRPLA